MKIESPVFGNNQLIPAKYTCDGENINPPLEFLDVPIEAKSLVLIVDDPDAPSGTWVHWTIWNIDPHTTQIVENSVPLSGVQGNTTYGKPGYGGPCPPSGTHRYFFKLYALDTKFDLPPAVQKPELEKAMLGRILAHDEIIGLYRRE